MSQLLQGLLRLYQIIGEEEITEDQAAANCEYNKQAAAEAVKDGHLDKNGNPVYARRPTTPRPATPPIIPVGKTCWWDGVKSGRFPRPVKLGRVTAWKVEDIAALIESLK